MPRYAKRCKASLLHQLPSRASVSVQTRLDSPNFPGAKIGSTVKRISNAVAPCRMASNGITRTNRDSLSRYMGAVPSGSKDSTGYILEMIDMVKELLEECRNLQAL